MTRVTKTLMLERGRAGSKESGCRKLQRVEGSRTITFDDLVPSGKILHGTTKGVKFHRAVNIDSELANGNQIINKIR